LLKSTQVNEVGSVSLQLLSSGQGRGKTHLWQAEWTIICGVTGFGPQVLMFATLLVWAGKWVKF
jgi:hypothetical protein